MMSTHLPSPNKTYETFNMDWDYAFESPFPLPAEMWDDSNAQPRTLPFTNSDALMLGFSLDHLVHDDEQDDIVDTLGRLETGGSSDDELIVSNISCFLRYHFHYDTARGRCTCSNLLSTLFLESIAHLTSLLTAPSLTCLPSLT